MKRYLNRQEQEDIVYLSAFIGQLQDMASRDGNKKQPMMDKNVSGWLKRVAALAHNQVLCPIVDGLEPHARQQALRAAKGNKIYCAPNERADLFLERLKAEQTEEQCLINVNTFQDVLEMALYACDPCKCKTEEERENCSGRLAFLALDVPVYDENAMGCPYLVSKQEG